jgi:YggT family protein
MWAVKDGPVAQTHVNWGQSARWRGWPLFLRGASRYSSMGHPTEHAMNPFLWLVDTVITLYIWILIAAALLSWLVAFNVVNARNPIVANIGEFLYRVTEPALRPIRSVLPNLGGIDISPVILIIGLLFLKQLIFWLYVQIFL